jgi:hypothetical protein
MKRLVLVVVGLCALVVAVPVAQTAPTQPNGCSVEHISGAECQGPDLAPAADSCNISTWVNNASCDLTVSDGAANITSGFVQVFAALEGTDWHTAFHLDVRDKATGEVLFSRDGSNTTPVSSGSMPPNQILGFSGTLSVQGASEVVCQVTGTHSPAGAAFSAAAALQGFGDFNNVLRCEVH